jgi:hypothetical protein
LAVDAAALAPHLCVARCRRLALLAAPLAARVERLAAFWRRHRRVRQLGPQRRRLVDQLGRRLRHRGRGDGTAFAGEVVVAALEDLQRVEALDVLGAAGRTVWLDRPFGGEQPGSIGPTRPLCFHREWPVWHAGGAKNPAGSAQALVAHYGARGSGGGGGESHGSEGLKGEGLERAKGEGRRAFAVLFDFELFT